MAPIDSLPSELLLHVLELACPNQHFGDRFFLSRVALVSKQWTFPARTLLWRMVFLASDATAQKVLSSPGLGRFQTNEMRLSGKGVTASSTAQILSRVRGLKDLSMCSYSEDVGLDFEALSYANLRDISSIFLENVHFQDSTGVAALPFSLKAADIRECSFQDATAPYSFFVSERMDYLQIIEPISAGPEDEQDEDVTTLVTAVAPHLTSFHFDCDLLPDLIPVFATFTKLTVLTIRCEGDELRDVLTLLRSQLDELNFSPIEAPKSVVNTLRTIIHLPSLKKLADLSLLPLRRSEIAQETGGGAALTAWDKKGVKIEFLTDEPLEDDGAVLVRRHGH